MKKKKNEKRNNVKIPSKVKSNVRETNESKQANENKKTWKRDDRHWGKKNWREKKKKENNINKKPHTFRRFGGAYRAGSMRSYLFMVYNIESSLEKEATTSASTLVANSKSNSTNENKKKFFLKNKTNCIFI